MNSNGTPQPRDQAAAVTQAPKEEGGASESRPGP